MTEENQATFQVKSWDEKPAQELADGAKITRAVVKQTYSGIISGDSSVEYVMFHRGDGTAVFTGVEHIIGTVGGKSGSFIIQHKGTFQEGTARSDWAVVSKSGTGELEGIEGNGSFSAGHGGQGEVTFNPVLS